MPKKATIVRTIMLVIGLINTVCLLFGFVPLPISQELVYNAVSALYLIGVAIYGFWKNNSFSKEAITADRLLAGLKKGLFEVDNTTTEE